MAKYKDYVQKDEAGITEEIQDAERKTEDRREAAGESLPDRFKDKTPEEIAASYVELEKAYSKQGNDLGKMRSTMDEYLTNLQSVQPNASPEEVVEPVTIDDVYENPEEAISRAAHRAVGDKINELEQELAHARLQTRVESLNDKFGNWQETVQTPEFINWVQESPYRQRIASQADGFDMDAAEEILGLYGDRTGLQSLKAEAQRDAALKDAGLESGGAEVPVREKTYSRSDVMEKRIAANRGDASAKSWLTAHAEGIAIAYEEGTLTD